MYLPAAFSEQEPARLWELMERYSFATLVSATAAEPAISQMPLLLERERGPQGTILGHFARANPHWRAGAGRISIAVFQGPHAYVSPRWYAEPNVVPTWNYVTVHATGVLHVVDDRDWLRTLVERTVNLYEASQPDPWRMDSQDPAFIDRLLGAIVGFELPIDKLEGKWKLSQNHSRERRERVVAELSASAGENERAIAELMAAEIGPS